MSRQDILDKRDEAKKLLLEDIDPMAQKKEVKEARQAVEKDERENFALWRWNGSKLTKPA